MMKKNTNSTDKRSFVLKLLQKSARFRKADDGVMAIEFAIVALPFLTLVFAIFETCLSFFAAQALETAVDAPARQIRTRQITFATHPTAADLKPVICAGGLSLFDCNNLQIDVQVLPGFTAPSTPRNPQGNLDPTAMSYAIGSPGDIVMIRAYYEWPVFLDRLQSGSNNMSNGKRLLVATSAFRIE